ncbi:MAG TPA: hypothetical protein VJP45_08355 [Candidatus Limnocylindria bacterium]|nr:hypothetical protein [Candidatus Limnocylindria bacterium]
MPSPSATPTATPTPTVDPARYGFVAGTNGRIVVRSERSGEPVLAIAGDLPSVSHDGKRIAFWRRGPQGGNPPQLRIAELPGGAERHVLTLASGSVGDRIVWSNDDSGLLYAVHSTEFFPGIGGGPRFARLESVELTASAPQPSTHPDLALTDGRVIVPLAWDNTGRTASALTTGEGGMSIDYITWDRAPGVTQNVVKRTRFPWTVVAHSVRASHDSKRMLAIDVGANVLRVWPTADISQAGMVAGGGGRIVDAAWRTGVVGDIAWIVDQTLSVFTYQTDSVRVIHRGQSFVLIHAWRADGTAIAINEQGRGDLLVDVAAQQAAALPDVGGSLAGGVFLR